MTPSSRPPPPAPTYVSPRSQARLLIAMLRVFAVVGVAACVLGFLNVRELTADRRLDDAALARIEERELIAGVAYLLAFVATAILFVRFNTRVYRNVQALGRSVPEFTAASMSWWYLVPVLCFARPYQAMRAVWLASRLPSARPLTSTPELTAWWAAWVVGLGLRTINHQLSKHATTGDEVILTAWLDLAQIAATIAAALFATHVVDQLTELQDLTWTERD